MALRDLIRTVFAECVKELPHLSLTAEAIEEAAKVVSEKAVTLIETEVALHAKPAIESLIAQAKADVEPIIQAIVDKATAEVAQAKTDALTTIQELPAYVAKAKAELAALQQKAV